MPTDCPTCLRPLPVVPAQGPVAPRTGEEALLLDLITQGHDTASRVTAALTGGVTAARVQQVRRRLLAMVDDGLLEVAGVDRDTAGRPGTRYRVRGR